MDPPKLVVGKLGVVSQQDWKLMGPGEVGDQGPNMEHSKAVGTRTALGVESDSSEAWERGSESSKNILVGGKMIRGTPIISVQRTMQSYMTGGE